MDRASVGETGLKIDSRSRVLSRRCQDAKNTPRIRSKASFSYTDLAVLVNSNGSTIVTKDGLSLLDGLGGNRSTREGKGKRHMLQKLERNVGGLKWRGVNSPSIQMCFHW
jgi:hypothetical protein